MKRFLFLIIFPALCLALVFGSTYEFARFRAAYFVLTGHPVLFNLEMSKSSWDDLYQHQSRLWHNGEARQTFAMNINVVGENLVASSAHDQQEPGP